MVLHSRGDSVHNDDLLPLLHVHHHMVMVARNCISFPFHVRAFSNSPFPFRPPHYLEEEEDTHRFLLSARSLLLFGIHSLWQFRLLQVVRLHTSALGNSLPLQWMVLAVLKDGEVSAEELLLPGITVTSSQLCNNLQIVGLALTARILGRHTRSSFLSKYIL